MAPVSTPIPPPVVMKDEDLLPVSLLCGFLGAGKTTLLKHVLETKHAEEGFKCAVIVNDMAALNIDKSLIDQSALVQSDEVVAMQNGCFCCTLQSDLVDQIKDLAKKKLFNYMLIEASGVSEPSQIAPLFDLCDDDHDPDDPQAEEHDHTDVQLGEVARLDTCVTVVDSAEFYNNLGSMRTYEQGETMGTIADLLMEQVEFSNVIILNKGDLVSEYQQTDIMEKISLLNPKAKVVKSIQSKINVMEILNTKLYSQNKDNDEFWVTATKVEAKEKVEENTLECCEKTMAEGKKKCCKSKAKDGQLIDTGLSQILLGVVPKTGQRQTTRHEQRFGITSFVYRARRPFHPGRLYDVFLEPFFVLRFLAEEEDEEEEEDEDDEDEDGKEKNLSEKEKKEKEQKKVIREREKEARLEILQKEATEKQTKRTDSMGELLRSKGFVWIASTHNIMGGWQQAGNVIRIEAENPWMCFVDGWEEAPAAEVIKKDMVQESGEEYEYMDRRQELVFIGHKLDHAVIQKKLDLCLLTNEEMVLGPEKWEETMAAEDKINMKIDEPEEDDGGEEEEEEDEEEGEEGDDDSGSESPAKKPRILK